MTEMYWSSARVLSTVTMVMNLESFGVDGVGYDETETEPGPPT